MKKNKKIAPSLYSRIRNYNKKQDGGYFQWGGGSGFNTTSGTNAEWGLDGEIIGRGMFDWLPTKEERQDWWADRKARRNEGSGAEVGGEGEVGGGGGGGGAGIASALDYDDGSDMFYSGAEIGADAGRLLAGDPTAALDMVKNVIGRGTARKHNRLQTSIVGDELTAANRAETRQELERIGSTTTDMGTNMDVKEGNYAVRVKEGGMKYGSGDFKLGNVGRSDAYSGGGSGYLGSTFENVNVTEDEYNTLTNPGYNVGLYGGTKLHTKGTFADNPHSPDTENQTTYMLGTKETVLPREQRLGINPFDHRGAMFADQLPDRIKYRSEDHATYLNDRQMRREQDKRRDFQQKLADATEVGKEKKFLRKYNRDVKRFEKRGNTESGFRNLLRKIISPIIPKWGTEYANEDAKFEYGRGYKQGGMKLEGGSVAPIPGTDAVEFKGRRHSQGGIFDDNSEVEHGETKDGVSSAKHGGMQMPYYFSDYVNTNGSKRYGGHSFADAHKELLKEGGSQAEIDALAAAQDKASGRNSKVAGYAQKGDFKYFSTNDKQNLLQNTNVMRGESTMPGTTPIPQHSGTGFTDADKITSLQDKTRVAPFTPIQPYSDRLDAFVNRDRSKPVTDNMRESILGPSLSKINFMKNFRKQGGMKYQDGSFEGMPYGDRRNFLLENYGFDIGRSHDFGSQSDFGEQAFIDSLNTGTGFDGTYHLLDEVELVDDLPDNTNTDQQTNNNNTNNTTNTTNTVTQSGNTTAVPTFVNPYSTMDKVGLGASMLAPLAAYTAKAPQMQPVGDVSAVETPQLKYQNFFKERAINEANYRALRKFVETSGGGPADMINMMVAHSKKTEADAAITDKEMKHRTTIDNLQAELDMKADTINVGNELQLKNLKQNANKINVMLQADQQANKVSALQTAAANLVTANRDKKAYDAGLLLANAIDGGSGVLGRALNPEDLQAEIDKYLKGEGNRNKVDSKKKVTTVVTDDDHDDHAGHDHEDISSVSDSTSFNPDLNVINRLGTEGDPHFGPLASVGMFNLQDAILQEDYAGEGFTVTSAMRGIDHSMHNKGSKHSKGNAIDFGVQNKDGKAMMKFFFNDWDGDAIKLSEKGKEFLRANNAELIDERTRKGQEHFHLEFNKIDGKERKFYAPGQKTKKGDFLIYGMQQ